MNYYGTNHKKTGATELNAKAVGACIQSNNERADK